MGKTTRKYKKRDEVASIVARIHGVSDRYVQMVRNGERDDEEITETLVEYTQGKEKLIQTITVQRAIERHAKSRNHASKKN